MKPKTLAACAVLLVSVAPFLAVRQQTFAQETEGSLNTVSFNLTSAHLDPLEGNNVIPAFVPTGAECQDIFHALTAGLRHEV